MKKAIKNMKIFVLPEEGQIQIQIITFILIFPNTNKNNLHTMALGDQNATPMSMYNPSMTF